MVWLMLIPSAWAQEDASTRCQQVVEQWLAERDDTPDWVGAIDRYDEITPLLSSESPETLESYSIEVLGNTAYEPAICEVRLIVFRDPREPSEHPLLSSWEEHYRGYVELASDGSAQVLQWILEHQTLIWKKDGELAKKRQFIRNLEACEVLSEPLDVRGEIEGRVCTSVLETLSWYRTGDWDVDARSKFQELLVGRPQGPVLDRRIIGFHKNDGSGVSSSTLEVEWSQMSMGFSQPILLLSHNESGADGCGFEWSAWTERSVSWWHWHQGRLHEILEIQSYLDMVQTDEFGERRTHRESTWKAVPVSGGGPFEIHQRYEETGETDVYRWDGKAYHH